MSSIRDESHLVPNMLHTIRKRNMISLQRAWPLMVVVVMIGSFSSCYRPMPAETAVPTDLEVTRARLDETLDMVLRQRELNSDVHAAWQVLHGVLAYGRDFPINAGGNQTTAVAYLERGGYLKGWNFEPGDSLGGERTGLRAVLQPGSYEGQGHADQWLAVLAQCNLSLDQTIQVRGQKYQMRDMLEQVKLDVPYNHEEEFSWTLIGLSHYMPTSDEWTASDGEVWSLERLLDRELSQELSSSACGGTHRLIGISMALDKRQQEQGKMSPLWRDADALVSHAAEIARQFQNGDGSFSTNYFQRPGISADNAQVISTTGHTLEFVALTLDAELLKQPWMLRAVDRLCEVIQKSKDLPLECGGLYHAIHGLVVYRDKVFGPQDSASIN